MKNKLVEGYGLNGEYHFDFDRYFALNYNACMNNILRSERFDLDILQVFIENEFDRYELYKLQLYPQIHEVKYFKHKSLNIFAGIDLHGVSFCYGATEEIINYLSPVYQAAAIQKEKNDAEIYTLLSSTSGLVAHKTLFKAPEINLEGHYNNDFIPQYDKVCSIIDSNDTGLVLWHGIPGTGKTSMIRHLMTKGFKRKFLFIPSGYAEMLGEPGFNNLLIQPKYRGCVLIIEDAESLIKKTQERSAGMSNLLNLTDGLMKDVFGCLVIATFNTQINAIDSALTRGGRLKARYEFKKLTKEKVAAINNISQEMTLSEIFCETEKIVEEQKIGFKLNS